MHTLLINTIQHICTPISLQVIFLLELRDQSFIVILAMKILLGVDPLHGKPRDM